MSIQIGLLLTPQQLSTKPDTVRLLHNFGEVHIVTGEDHRGRFTGQSVIVNGEEADLKDWMRKYPNGIWFTKGSPQMEDFELRIVK